MAKKSKSYKIPPPPGKAEQERIADSIKYVDEHFAKGGKAKKIEKRRNEYKMMKDKIIKALTRVKVPRKTASLYVKTMRDQLIPKEINKAKYDDIRKMFWNDIEHDWKQGY